MTDFAVPNPNYADALRSGMLAFPIARWLGLAFGPIAPGEAEVVLPYREELTVGGGIFQAGIVGTLADIAAGCAAGTLLPAGHVLVTCDYTVKLVAPAAGERLVARGSVVRPGHALTVSRAEVFAVRGTSERLCAVALATTMSMAGAASSRPPA